MAKPKAKTPTVVRRTPRTTDGLRESLFVQVDQLGAGVGDWNRARVMAQVGAQIISAAYLDLEYARRGIADVKSITLVASDDEEKEE